MKKEIPFKLAPDHECTLRTREMRIPDFAEAFLSHALNKVRTMVQSKEIKSLPQAVDFFTDVVDEELTFFLRNNDIETKHQVLEWLLESVVGEYMNHFLKHAAAKAFTEPEE